MGEGASLSSFDLQPFDVQLTSLWGASPPKDLCGSSLTLLRKSLCDSGMSNYVYLAIAIIAEVIATSTLKASAGFSKFLPSAVTVVGYGVSFYCLALTLRTIPVGVAYAIWSGVGVALISIIGWLWFKQTLDWAAIAGISLIVSGVIVLNMFSKTAVH